MKKRIIWSSDIDVKDWVEETDEDTSSLAERDKLELAVEYNNNDLDCIRADFDIQYPEEIVIIADIGRWNGRISGYKLIKSGNLKDCFYSDTDCVEWYVDNKKNLRATATHHDGTNYYLYRAFKDGVSNIQKENFLDKIYNGTVTNSDISRLTKRLGDEFVKVYGF